MPSCTHRTSRHSILRAGLEQDDRALQAVRLNEGPVHLLVQRTPDGVDIVRLSGGVFRIATVLFAGELIRNALSRARMLYRNQSDVG